MIEYSPEELEKAQSWCPEISYCQDKNSIVGTLRISPCHYKKKSYPKSPGRNPIWEILQGKDNQGRCTTGEYSIEINFDQKDSWYPWYPKVYELSGKIEKLAAELGMQTTDLHLYPQDDACCLGISINPVDSLSEFVLHVVHPYFVWQAYYAQHEKVPPCGEYSHGTKGHTEAISDYEETITSISKFGRNKRCPCERGKNYSDCCWHEDKEKKQNLRKWKQSVRLNKNMMK